MSSIGLFDVRGLTNNDPRFGITSPLFDRITISLNNKYHSGSQFIIETENNSPENVYVHTASLNGKKLESLFVPFHSVVSGGKLSFVLGNTPKE
jgi:putative alpha-1,2-mannosidase